MLHLKRCQVRFLIILCHDDIFFARVRLMHTHWWRLFVAVLASTLLLVRTLAIAAQRVSLHPEVRATLSCR